MLKNWNKLVQKKVNLELEISYIAKSSDSVNFILIVSLLSHWSELLIYHMLGHCRSTSGTDTLQMQY